MSNSGGSWGPDGRLWLTGHDLGEAYVMEPPRAGSELRWIATVRLPGVEGQGIAWDLSGPRPTLWAIKRSTKQVLQFDVPFRSIATPPADDGRSTVRGTSSRSGRQAAGRRTSMTMSTSSRTLSAPISPR
jgi:hypothetical protein